MNNIEINHLTKPAELKKAGVQVEITHWRGKKNDPTGDIYRRVEFENYSKEVDERRGATEVVVVFPDKRKFKAQAYCHPVDNFNRKKSIAICFGRIGKQIEEQKFLDFAEKNNIQPAN